MTLLTVLLIGVALGRVRVEDLDIAVSFVGRYVVSRARGR